jgi:hypothetical protein
MGECKMAPMCNCTGECREPRKYEYPELKKEPTHYAMQQHTDPVWQAIKEIERRLTAIEAAQKSINESTGK